jgi:hypothetical protein
LALDLNPGKAQAFPQLTQLIVLSLFLSNEFLQITEFSVDQIIDFFSKIIHTPAFSVPSKHNSGQQLQDELPADLMLATLVWVHCGGVIGPLCGSMQRAAHLHHPSWEPG